ncbi:MAG: ABC transporter ATP-binding protein/permease, partial [Clostridia bacterium]|nr:ABC transporter ATP-binding protein/permease [Clostridia bacterium]
TVLESLVAIIGVAMALFSKEVLNNHSNHNKLLWFGVALITLTLFNIIITGLVSVVTVRVSGRLTISMRNYMFSALVRKKYPQISSHHSGDLLNRFTSDADVIISAMTNTLPGAIAIVVRLIVGFVVLATLNWRLALIIGVVGFSFPAAGRKISRRYKYMHKEVQKTEGQARSFMQEGFANIVVIKSFRSEAPILRKLNEYMDQNLKMKIKRNFVSVIIHVLLNSFFNLGYYGVLVWGAVQLGSGSLHYGDLMAYLQLISQLRSPLQSVSGLLPQYYSAMASAERLMDIENIEDEPAQPEDEELEKLRRDFQKISIKNLAFAYDKEVILRNCTFDIPRGEITAITGESGCGKSTLFKIVLGLYEPAGGSITVNDDIPVSSATRGLFAYVPQGNMILSGTIRENITMCNSEVSEERIIEAAKAAAIYDFIETLPDGLDTVVSERGAGLSEGQIQRISIARALLFDTPILLLDEATSALDETTETTVLSNIRNLEGKTVIFITHRHTSLSVCDHIVHAENRHFTVVK